MYRRSFVKESLQPSAAARLAAIDPSVLAMLSRMDGLKIVAVASSRVGGRWSATCRDSPGWRPLLPRCKSGPGFNNGTSERGGEKKLPCQSTISPPANSCHNPFDPAHLDVHSLSFVLSGTGLSVRLRISRSRVPEHWRIPPGQSTSTYNLPPATASPSIQHDCSGQLPDQRDFFTPRRSCAACRYSNNHSRHRTRNANPRPPQASTWQGHKDMLYRCRLRRKSTSSLTSLAVVKRL